MGSRIGVHGKQVAFAPDRGHCFRQIIRAQLGYFHHQVRCKVGARASQIAVEFIDVDHQPTKEQGFNVGGLESILQGV